MNVVNRTLRTPLARLLAFVLGAASSLVFAVFAAGFALGIIGAVRPMVAMALASAVASAALLVMTLGLLRREGLGMSALGLPVSGQRAREFALGFVVSAALFIAVAWTQSAMVGASWAFQGAPGALAALWGLPLAASMVMAEELLFRGAALRYLRQIFGDRSAIVVSAACFGAYHLIGSQHLGHGRRLSVPDADGGRAAVRMGRGSQRRSCLADRAAPGRQLGPGQHRRIHHGIRQFSLAVRSRDVAHSNWCG